MILFILTSLLFMVGSRIEKERNNLRSIRAEIKKNRDQIAQLKIEESSILRIIDAYDSDRELTERYIKRLKVQSQNLLTEIDTLSITIESIEKKLVKNKTEVKKELLNLYIWRRFYKLDMILSAKSIPEVYQTSWNLRLISRLGEKKIHNYQKLLEEYEMTREDKKSLLFELAEVQNAKEEELVSLTNTIAEKKDLLSSIRSKKAKSVLLEKELKDAQRKLENLIEDLIAKSKAITPVQIPSLKSMGWPCKGEVISNFGKIRHPKYNTTTRNNGIDIKADKGTPVYAVATGSIAYSGRFLGYGNIIMIEHKGGLYSIYGHLERIMIQPGDKVDVGQQIATVGDTGSLAGPMLHFELRKGGKPIDPLSWLK